MRAMERRVATLEQANPIGEAFYIFAGRDETSDQVIARRFPGGAPRNARLIVYRWDDGPPDEGAERMGWPECADH
jgi:hypothetical protein